jgi:hypothetical protein
MQMFEQLESKFESSYAASVMRRGYHFCTAMSASVSGAHDYGRTRAAVSKPDY